MTFSDCHEQELDMTTADEVIFSLFIISPPVIELCFKTVC